MAKFLYFLMTLAIMLSCIYSDLYAIKINGKGFTIVIDPGHGGYDTGATYQKIKEKDIVLNLSLKLGKYISVEMPDAEVIFTRKTDVFIPLHERADKAISGKADLFLSIHANSCSSPSVNGTETFVLGMHRTEENLEVAKKENAVILIEEDYSTRYEGFDPNSSESYIMFDLVQEEYFNQSVSIAALVQNNFKNHANRKDRGVKQAGFLVLRQTSMPSILIEAGYLSNTDEATYLNSEKGQEELAKAICSAIKSYKTNYETKNEFELRAVTGEDRAQKEESEEPEDKTQEISLPITETNQTKTSQIVEKSCIKPVYYSIQIAVAHKKLEMKPYNFRGLKSVYALKIDGLYKYYYGKESNYEEILKRKDEAKQHYNDAFITAFYEGKQISIQEARSLQME